MTQHRSRAWIAVAVVAAAIAWLTLRPAHGFHRPLPVRCVICGDYGAEDFVLNVAMFIPLGLTLRMAGVSTRRAFLIGLASTVSIELLQFTIVAGRDATLGDVLANSGGALIGALLADRWRALLLPSSPTARGLVAVAAPLWCATFVLAAWAFEPSPTARPYHGQHAPDLGHLARFTGQLQAVRLDDREMPIGVLADKPRIDSLLRAATIDMEVVATAGGTTDRIAPIGSVFDEGQDEIVLLGRDGDAAIFHVRLRAARLHLRAPGLELDGAFTGDGRAPLDTGALVRLRGRRTGAEYAIAIQTPHGNLDRKWSARATLGWVLFYPFTYHFGMGDPLATALWLALPALVLAYWSERARSRHGSGTGAVAWLMFAVAAVVGMVIVPVWMGYQAALWWEWCAALVGATVGALIAWRLRAARRQERPRNERPASRSKRRLPNRARQS